MNPSGKPLKGKHVLITRGGEQGEKFCMDVASTGGIPHMVPLIDFRMYKDPNESYYFRQLGEYDWIIFTSKNGVHYFFEHLKKYVDDYSLLQHSVQFAVVGEKTKEALDRYQLASCFMPHVFTAEEFVREFFQNEFVAKKVLVPKGNLAKSTIADGFRSQGISADEWIIYETFYPVNQVGRLIPLLKEDVLDVASFTSPSSFNHFMKIVKQQFLTQHVSKLTFAAIGTVTKRAIENEGYQVGICPEKFTIDKLFQEICRYFQEKEGKDLHEF
ncbi:uroporphyrinogen-III synthase [Lederbergia sp. NSJ-179]|uniref:uroporphyrinogen-III synthase n=1 Tax=Lederbergia sp. NSJ-179 TaxID=2931402 RepID=UPI001FD10848|nr:uroporphyrinogen-III synthase [Lederbergia sp. NSJ-179]MCJ7839888.1 uroporphyrinogen-III synthase [Lederbergia sp. NSJ-179]